MEGIKFEFVSKAPEDVTKFGLPVRKTSGSAGYDFIAHKDMTIFPGQMEKCETFIKAKMPPGVALLLIVRSSIGIKRDSMLPNCVGLIDSDYYNNPDNEGSIIGALRNNSPQIVHIKRGEAFMQGFFVPYFTTEDDDAQGVRVGGIGSTNLQTEAAVPVA